MAGSQPIRVNIDCSRRFVLRAGSSPQFLRSDGACGIFSLIVWSLWVTDRDPRLFFRAIVIALLAYGLSAFWLTPSYLGITASNLKLVAEPGNIWSRWIAIAGALSFAAASWWFARNTECASYTIFISGAVLCFSCVVIGHYYFGFRVSG